MEAFRHNLVSVLDEAKNSYKNLTSIPIEDDSEKEKIEDKELIVEEADEEVPEDEIVEESNEAVSSEEEKPMWAQFLSEDQMEVMMSRRETEVEESDDDSLIVEDEYDELIEETKEETKNSVSLSSYLHEKEAQLIKVLFNGKDKEYHSDIKEIEKLKNWEQASEYVETQIFSKEHVDMFSEEAIELIDALQTFFKEYKS
jgi:hypothetical protein